MQKGYNLLDVYEVYEYAVTQYDPQTGQGGLFVEYRVFQKELYSFESL